MTKICPCFMQTDLIKMIVFSQTTGAAKPYYASLVQERQDGKNCVFKNVLQAYALYMCARCSGYGGYDEDMLIFLQNSIPSLNGATER